MIARRLRLALLLLPLAPLAWADFKDTYRKGIEAVDRKRWAEVAQHMREAIGQNPKEGAAVKLYGTRFETYLPHFHLGYALSQTGDCPGALRSLEASESQGAVRASPSYRQLVDAKAACQRLVAAAAPATTLPAPPTLPPAPTTTLPPLPGPTPGPPSTTRPPPPTTPSPPPGAPSTTVPAAPVAAPAGLVRAAEAYFAGRYDESVSLLDRLTGLTGRPAAQAHLLRAAARFALYRMGGERDVTLRQRVLEDVVACRQADPRLSPDAEAFPPPFAELFRGGR